MDLHQTHHMYMAFNKQEQVIEPWCLQEGGAAERGNSSHHWALTAAPALLFWFNSRTEKHRAVQCSAILLYQDLTPE